MTTTEEPKDPKLNFTIVHCSSEDESFPVAQLVRHTTTTRGWHSAKLCEYPQDIILRFNGEVKISMIKLLSHETKIASRIDLSVCRPDRDHQDARSFPPLNHATFHRLGYLTFTNNEESGFESRELKTAQISTRAVYLKLSLRRCHPNVSNVFNQVGIVAFGIYGEMLNEFEAPQDDHDSIYGEHLPGSVREAQQPHQVANEVPLSALAVINNSHNNNSNNHDGNGNNSNNTRRLVGSNKMDSRVASKIDDLSHKKIRAVDSDDFDEAKRLKIVIDRLRDAGMTLADLEERKRRAVESEDYDVAKALKLQIDEAKKNVDYELEFSEKQGQNNNHNHGINNHNQDHQQNENQQQQQHHSTSSPSPPSNAHQQTVKPQAAHNSFDDTPVGGGSHGGAHHSNNNKKNDNNLQHQFDEKPVGGGGGASIPFDEQPVGGGNRGIPFDEQPVGVSHKSNTVSSPPVAVAAAHHKHEQQHQQKESTTTTTMTTSNNNNNNNHQQQEEAPHGLNQEFKATDYDEKPAISSGVTNRIEQMNDDTGGIVVKKNPDAAAAGHHSNVEVADSDWERAIRAMILSELPSDVHEPDALPSPNLPAELVNHTTHFGRYATACLISKKFQHREATVRVLGSENGVSILKTKGGKKPTHVVPELVTYFAEKGRGVDDGISQVFFAVCDALKTIITGGINCNGDGVTAYDVNQGVCALIPGLLLKAGDSNQRVREHAAATLMLIAMSPIGPEKIAAALLHDPQTESKKPLNFRVQSARISLATVMVNKVGLSTKAKPTGLTPEGLTKQLCIPQLTHSNSEVREGAVHLIVLLYGLVKPSSKMDSLLTDVKPAQKALIDEQLDAMKEDDKNGNVHNNSNNNSKQHAEEEEHQAEEELKSSSVTVSGPAGTPAHVGGNKTLNAAREAAKAQKEALLAKQNPPNVAAPGGKKAPAAKPGNNKKVPPSPATTPRGGPKTKTPAGRPPVSSPAKSPAAKKTANAPSPKKTAVGSKAPAGKPGAKKSVPAPPPPPPQAPQQDDNDDEEDDPHTCQFCGVSDPRYDEESLDRHYLRSCPLLCACPLCGQICEISLLQEHLTTECNKSSLVKQCPNCHEAVRASDLDAHIADASCIKHNPAMYNVCPLCHEKTAPGDGGWKAHFAKSPGCANNPRPYHGGDIEEDFKA